MKTSSLYRPVFRYLLHGLYKMTGNEQHTVHLVAPVQRSDHGKATPPVPPPHLPVPGCWSASEGWRGGLPGGPGGRSPSGRGKQSDWPTPAAVPQVIGYEEESSR